MSDDHLSSTNVDNLLDGFVAEWGKARIQDPLQLISRLDDSAKQFIAVSGVVQGILVGVAKLGAEGRPLSTYAFVAFGCLLLTIALATVALVLQSSRVEVYGFYQIFQDARDGTIKQKIHEEIEEWCKSISLVTRAKRILLGLSALLLIAGLLSAVVCVAKAMEPKGGGRDSGVEASVP